MGNYFTGVNLAKQMHDKEWRIAEWPKQPLDGWAEIYLKALQQHWNNEDRA